MRYKLDSYEKRIEKEANLYKPADPQKRNKVNSILKKENFKKIVTLRLNNLDLQQIKDLAEDEGIPYQTLISSVLHKFISKKYFEKDEVLKIMHMAK